MCVYARSRTQERQFPQVGTTVSSSGNESFPKWERRFPQVETAVTASGNGNNLTSTNDYTKEKLQKTGFSPLQLPYFFILTKRGLLCLHSIVFVRNSQFLSAFSTTCCQYSAAVCCSHSLTETVFVLSLSVRGLKCSFHYCILFLCYYSHEFGLQK